MVRLIGFIIGFALFLVFIGLNLGNKCDVSFGFHKFTEAPIFITVFVSFFLGMICSIPLALSFKGKKSPPRIKDKPKKKGKSGNSAYLEEIPGENGPYGID